MLISQACAGFKRIYPHAGGANSFRKAIIEDRLESFFEGAYSGLFL